MSFFRTSSLRKSFVTFFMIGFCEIFVNSSNSTSVFFKVPCYANPGSERSFAGSN